MRSPRENVKVYTYTSSRTELPYDKLSSFK